MTEISEGSYLARATSLAYITSGQKRTPGWEVHFVLTEDGPFKGRDITWVGWATEKTQEQTAKSMAICGFDGRDKASIAANVVQLVVEHEIYKKDEGTADEKIYTNAKVRWINDPNRSRSVHNVASAADEQQAMERMRGLVLAQKEALAKTAPAGTGASFPHGANAGPEPKF